MVIDGLFLLFKSETVAEYLQVNSIVLCSAVIIFNVVGYEYSILGQCNNIR
jgi:hypothetical protein